MVEEDKKTDVETDNSAPQKHQSVKERLIDDELKTSYLDYAMSVIVGRALPDVRDGLKPVHRRVLFAMNELGMVHSKPFKKSARVVGEVLGKYHPHGDSAVYDTMVRMVQDFSLRYPLLEGQGNFGSVDGDSAAAMRYTEIRMAKTAEEMLEDIEKETVDMQPNFDGTLQEPIVLPAKLPNLLINGTSGIAVGMATNMPPHNITEVCDGVISMIDNPDITVADINSIITGPDFPTGGIIQGRNGIRSAYQTGRGKVKVKAVAEIEEHKGRFRIIVTEIPYQVNKAQLIEDIAALVSDKKIVGISDIRDESDRDGMRIVIEIKKDANADVVLNQLYTHTRMQTVFGIINLALVNNQPMVLDIKEIIRNYIEHRVDIIKRKTIFDLRKAEERNHILDGLVIALNNIDEVVQGIKKSEDTKAAEHFLITTYSLSEVQAKSILDMKLQKLSSLETEKIRQEKEEIAKLIIELKTLLESRQMMLDIIKKELGELKQKYGDKRKTRIEEGDEDIDMEDLIEQQDVVVTISHAGYIKRIPIDTYKAQNRGGKGIIGAETREEDFIEDIFIANTHSYILFFTNTGQVHWLKVYNIPEAGRQAMGKAIINLIQIEPGEKINAFVPIKEFGDGYLFMTTKNGVIKKSELSLYGNPRAGGIRAIILDEGDQLISVKYTDGNNNVIIATKDGMAVKFDEKDARPIGRTARGVKGITLREGDEVVGMEIADDEKTLLTITENGYGKRTPINEYRLINRGGIGVINIQTTERNGRVVDVKTVTEEDEIIMISKNGIIIRVPVRTISVIGRNTQGVRIMKMDESDKVQAAAKIAQE